MCAYKNLSPERPEETSRTSGGGLLADEFVCFQASDSFVSIRRVLNDYKDRFEIAKFTLINSGLTVFHAGQSHTGGDNFDCSQWCVIVTQT